MKQEQIVRHNRERQEIAEETKESLGKAAVANAELDRSVEDMLDEIDDVLETNAEEFIENFVQKGGE